MRNEDFQIEYGEFETAVRLLRDQYGHIDVITTGHRPEGFSPLHMLCKAPLKCLTEANQKKAIKFMMEQGADIALPCGGQGNNPVMMAAGSGCLINWNFFYSQPKTCMEEGLN